MFGGRKTTVRLLRRGKRSVFKYSRNTNKGRMVSYIVTTPKRHISKRRIRYIRNSKTLRSAFRKRRASRRAHMVSKGTWAGSKRRTMYNRERRAIRRHRRSRR